MTVQNARMVTDVEDDQGRDHQGEIVIETDVQDLVAPTETEEGIGHLTEDGVEEGQDHHHHQNARRSNHYGISLLLVLSTWTPWNIKR